MTNNYVKSDNFGSLWVLTTRYMFSNQAKIMKLGRNIYLTIEAIKMQDVETLFVVWYKKYEISNVALNVHEETDVNPNKHSLTVNVHAMRWHQ